MSDLTNEELSALCKRVMTWDQAELDNLLGRTAIAYAEAHERDVRRLADEMWECFPLSGRWFKVGHALRNVFAKNDAIRARAAQIGKDRAAGRIVESWGDLVYVDVPPAQ